MVKFHNSFGEFVETVQKKFGVEDFITLVDSNGAEVDEDVFVDYINTLSEPNISFRVNIVSASTNYLDENSPNSQINLAAILANGNGLPKLMGIQMQNDALTERLHAERIAMDMLLQLAASQIPGYPGINPLLHLASGAYPRAPTLIPCRDALGLGLHPDILGRPYPPELDHHVMQLLEVILNYTP